MKCVGYIRKGHYFVLVRVVGTEIYHAGAFLAAKNLFIDNTRRIEVIRLNDADRKELDSSDEKVSKAAGRRIFKEKFNDLPTEIIDIYEITAKKRHKRGGKKNNKKKDV